MTDSCFDEKTTHNKECDPVKCNYGDNSQGNEKFHGMVRIVKSRETSTRSVSFANQIVAEVRERPRTLNREKSTLFYSGAELSRFRQEYRQFVDMQQKVKVVADSTVFSTLMSFATNFQKNILDIVTAEISISNDKTSSYGTEERNTISSSELQEVLYLY